jgi:hypothetical protein
MELGCVEVGSRGTSECSLQVVALVLLGKIQFQEEESVAAVLRQRKQESRREQLLELIWVGCGCGAKGTKLDAIR